eukprot:150185_1
MPVNVSFLIQMFQSAVNKSSIDNKKTQQVPCLNVMRPPINTINARMCFEKGSCIDARTVDTDHTFIIQEQLPDQFRFPSPSPITFTGFNYNTEESDNQIEIEGNNSCFELIMESETDNDDDGYDHEYEAIKQEWIYRNIVRNQISDIDKQNR